MTYNNYNGDDNTTNLGSTSQKCNCAPRGSTRVKESSPMSLILGTVCNTLCVTLCVLHTVCDGFNTTWRDRFIQYPTPDARRAL